MEIKPTMVGLKIKSTPDHKSDPTDIQVVFSLDKRSMDQQHGFE